MSGRTICEKCKQYFMTQSSSRVCSDCYVAGLDKVDLSNVDFMRLVERLKIDGKGIRIVKDETLTTYQMRTGPQVLYLNTVRYTELLKWMTGGQ